VLTHFDYIFSFISHSPTRRTTSTKQ